MAAREWAAVATPPLVDHERRRSEIGFAAESVIERTTERIAAAPADPGGPGLLDGLALHGTTFPRQMPATRVRAALRAHVDALAGA
jgi:hypothetical protein